MLGSLIHTGVLGGFLLKQLSRFSTDASCTVSSEILEENDKSVCLSLVYIML